MIRIIIPLFFLIATTITKGQTSLEVLSISIYEGDILPENPLKHIKWEPLEAFNTMNSEVLVYWLRLKYKESANQNMRHGVLLLSRFFDKVESYKTPHASSAISITGRLVDNQDKTLTRGIYKNSLPLSFDKENTLYIKLTNYPLVGSISRSLDGMEYLSIRSFDIYSTKIHTIFTLAIGMEIIIFLIFLFLVYLKPSRENIFYLLLIFVSVPLIIIRNQVFDSFFDLNSQLLSNLEFCLTILVVYSFSAFSAHYIKVMEYSRFWYRFMASPYILLLIPAFFYFDKLYPYLLIAFYFIITIISATIFLIKFRKKNSHRANVFLLAICPITIAGVLPFLAASKIIPANFWTINSMLIPLVFRDFVFMTDLVLGFFRDKSLIAVKEIEVGQLQEEKKQLKKIEELKTTFFNNISHELRTPLTLLLGPLENVLNHGKLNKDMEQQLKMSMKNGTYLLQLVNEMLDLSKLDHGQLTITKKKQDIIPVLKGIIESFKNYATENKQTIYITHSSNQIFIDTDRDIFEKMIINLISNAIKYSKSTGEIHITVKEYKHSVFISVADSGIGIAPTDIDNIFKRYYRVDRKRSVSSTGIGLAIVKEFIELHNGNITVQSTLGKGSLFELSFPLVKDSAKSNTTIIPYAINDLTSIDPNKSLILLVEDNQDMRQYLEQHLSDYNLYQAANGQEALRLLKSIQKPDLIITDYMMPVMDGVEFIKTLKLDESFSMIPIIFLTARTLQGDKIKVLHMGIDDYIIKPFDKKELKLRINISLKNALNQKKSMSQSIDIFSLPEIVQFKKKLDAYIIENISNPKMSNIDLAYHFSISERSLIRKIKSATGQTPAAYIREIRLQSAKRKIEYNERASISEIAYELGMNNLSHFTQAFKKRFGKLPSEYFRKSNDKIT
ncbi:ATP-binding protein [Flavivirga jejuensis]|uniref:histidine kinase n=1 Tax=Flavivirga jejuensis TaxID=870487 RepID=A0ABT8WSD1_9FLAO|nr:ATP-binding protein [Flavivirga jejuensis]MDO5976093.1 response regulator [Flavivirga jejuensis]